MSIITFGTISEYETLYNECISTIRKYNNSKFVFIDSIHPLKIDWIKELLIYANVNIKHIDLNNINTDLCEKYDRRFLVDNAYIEPCSKLLKFNFILGRKQRDFMMALKNNNYTYDGKIYKIQSSYDIIEYTQEQLDIFYTYYRISKPYIIHNKSIYIVNSKDFYTLYKNSNNDRRLKCVNKIICSDYRRYGIVYKKRRMLISINLSSLIYLNKPILIYNYLINGKFVKKNIDDKIFSISYNKDEIEYTNDITNYSIYIK